MQCNAFTLNHQLVLWNQKPPIISNSDMFRPKRQMRQVLPLPHPMSESGWNGKEWLGLHSLLSWSVSRSKSENGWKRSSERERESSSSVCKGNELSKNAFKCVWERSATSSPLSHSSLRILNGEEEMCKWLSWSRMCYGTAGQLGLNRSIRPTHVEERIKTKPKDFLNRVTKPTYSCISKA